MNALDNPHQRGNWARWTTRWATSSDGTEQTPSAQTSTGRRPWRPPIDDQQSANSILKPDGSSGKGSR